ncbi:putative secreted protein [Byssothecium circinans]|uniref:Putative secreted protein n=1 Tax=Byssothecium circinans TaxID=147558 RepID=A0A6A5U5R3_9PLEO|nr:putative secreted protein [Byssothecium circinans]
MSKPQVLIVGCGAVGLLQGYYLSAGADITYLVRPGRKSAFTGPKHLYSYKDNELYTFSNYRLVESLSEISGETFAFVLDTLDGHTARSEAGTATITAVGDFINQKQNADCFVAYDAVGWDIEEHYVRTMRIAPTRLFTALSMLSHQPTTQISVPETADKDLVAKADLLFAYLPSKVGLIVLNTQPQLVTKLEAIYSANGKLGIQRLPAFVPPWFMFVNMLHLVTWYVDGYRPFEYLRGNKELWDLMVRAQTEIVTLPRSGWKGWLLSFVVKGWVAEKLNTQVIEGAKPLKMEEFNAFHHGGKVVKQDIRALEDILREGEGAGKKMTALREIVKRAEEKERQKVNRA